MEVRLARKTDRAAIHSLWKNTFGDAASFIEDSLDVFAEKEHVYVAAEDDIVLSQLLAVPCKIGADKGIYLYALATAPQARNKGAMTKLMRYAELEEFKNGSVFSVLIPATPSLFNYYKARGYTVTASLYWQATLLQRSIVTENKAVVSQIVPKLLQSLREKFCRCLCVSFKQEAFCFVTEDLKKEQFFILYAQNGYAVAKKNEGYIFVPEIFVQKGFETQFIDSMVEALGEGKYVVSSQSSVFSFISNTNHPTPFALLKPFTPKYSAAFNTFYLRFGFEDMQFTADSVYANAWIES